MFKHVAEAFVPLPHADWVMARVCDKSRDFCQSICETGADRLLDFDDARGILRPTAEGLHLRVEAKDLATFYGVRTLLLGSLPAFTTVSDDGIEWRPAAGVPFGEIRRHAGHGKR